MSGGTQEIFPRAPDLKGGAFAKEENCDIYFLMLSVISNSHNLLCRSYNFRNILTLFIVLAFLNDFFNDITQ